jgi:hypothetical protein
LQAGFVHREGKAQWEEQVVATRFMQQLIIVQEEHQSMVVESSGTLNHINVKILFDSGATNSFISPSALEKSGLGLLQAHDVPMTKWKVISMDFVVGFLLTSHRHNAILVIVDKLTKSAHFILIRDSYDVIDVAHMFVSEVIHFHGIPKKIISDRDSRFTSRFLTSLQSALGTQLNLSTIYHPEKDGKIERVNQVMEDMLRMYVMDNQTHWEKYLPLVEFSYNNSFHSSIRMPPYKALYGRPCRRLLSWERLQD